MARGGIAVNWGDVYVAGKDGTDAVYWVNGTKHILPKESAQDAEALAMFVE